MSVKTPIFLDNHSTTRVDPRVVEAMVACYTEQYGNAGSTSHSFGWDAAELVEQSRQSIAKAIGGRPKDIVFTSGATESNNLALKGVAQRQRNKGGHLISVATEHKGVLDPLARLARDGYEVSLLPVQQQSDPRPGLLDPQQLADAITDQTLLVSVMLANNEIGLVQPLAELAAICQEKNIILHCDATQAVGKLPVDVTKLGVDLMSFSAHKMHGPKGIGVLYVNHRKTALRIKPQNDGGGQEGGLRSGTLNVPGIVGLAKSLELSLEEMPHQTERLRGLRDHLAKRLLDEVPKAYLNGPSLDQPDWRLAHNLNLRFDYVDGQSLMMSMGELALSSGSACTSANPEPSHVLRAIGLEEDQIRGSLRFGLGRFTTSEEIDFAIDHVAEAVNRLRQFSSMA